MSVSVCASVCLSVPSSSVATRAHAPQPQSGRVMGIAEIRGAKKMGMGWGYRIILAKHRDECLNSELGLQSQSASALTAEPAYIVHRPIL